MDYKKIYDSLITRGKNRVLESYKERHHIVPRCMGGSDDKENLVDLTAEEHYVAHQLLVKIYPKNHSLARAAQMMIPNRKTNKLYGWLRKRFSEAMSIGQSGSRNSNYGKMWISNGIEEKKIVKGLDIPEGWEKSRLSNYSPNKEAERIRIAAAKAEAKKKKEEELLARENVKRLKEQERINQLKELRELHEIYKVEGFDGIKKTGYIYTKQNLVNQFMKLLPDFVSQNGKKRKKQMYSYVCGNCGVKFEHNDVLHSKITFCSRKCVETSNSGTMWVYNLVEKKNKKIKINEFYNLASQGWLKGRKMKF